MRERPAIANASAAGAIATNGGIVHAEAYNGLFFNSNLSYKEIVDAISRLKDEERYRILLKLIQSISIEDIEQTFPGMYYFSKINEKTANRQEKLALLDKLEKECNTLIFIYRNKDEEKYIALLELKHLIKIFVLITETVIFYMKKGISEAQKKCDELEESFKKYISNTPKISVLKERRVFSIIFSLKAKIEWEHINFDGKTVLYHTSYSYEYIISNVRLSFEKALNYNPDDFNIQSSYAWFLNYLGNPEEAIKLHRKTCISQPSNLYFQAGLAFSYHQMGDGAAAHGSYMHLMTLLEQQSIAQDCSGLSVALNNMVWFYLDLSRGASDKNDKVFFSQLAFTYSKKGNFSDASENIYKLYYYGLACAYSSNKLVDAELSLLKAESLCNIPIEDNQKAVISKQLDEIRKARELKLEKLELEPKLEPTVLGMRPITSYPVIKHHHKNESIVTHCEEDAQEISVLREGKRNVL